MRFGLIAYLQNTLIIVYFGVSRGTRCLKVRFQTSSERIYLDWSVSLLSTLITHLEMLFSQAAAKNFYRYIFWCKLFHG